MVLIKIKTMRVRVMQSLYSDDIKDADKLFKLKIKDLKECTNEDDLIVLPEYSDVPVVTNTEDETFDIHNRFIDRLHQECKETAIRCNAVVFYNALEKVGNKYRNTTFGVNSKGEIVARYYKRHIPRGELSPNFDSEYTKNREDVYSVTIDGIKYAFLTCYDLYFYEYFIRVAEIKPDIIIVCSLQRSDTHRASEIFSSFLAYNTNAYVVRSSVSYGKDSDICGASLVASPKGEILLNLKAKVGSDVIDIDPKEKYYKAAGFGGSQKSHFEYMKDGRIPNQYGLDEDKKK